MRPHVRVPALAILVSIAALAGCRPNGVAATVVNRTGAPLHMVEVDYPTASFGTNVLPPGGACSRRFIASATGPLRLVYEDAQGHPHESKGPTVRQGERGTLRIEVERDGKSEWRMEAR